MPQSNRSHAEHDTAPLVVVSSKKCPPIIGIQLMTGVDYQVFMHTMSCISWTADITVYNKTTP